MAKKRKGNHASKKQPTHRPRAPELNWKAAPASAPLSHALHDVALSQAPSVPAAAPAPAPEPEPAPTTREPAPAASAPIPVEPPPAVASAPALSVQSPTNRPAEPSTLAPVALDKTHPSGSVRLPPAPAVPAVAVATGEAEEEHDAHEQSFFDAPPPASFREPELLLEEEAPPPPVPVEVLQRRLLFRKAVSMFMGMAATLAIAVGVKSATVRPTSAEAFTAVASQKLSLVAEAQAASPVENSHTNRQPAAQPPARAAEPPAAASAAPAPPPAPEAKEEPREAKKEEAKEVKAEAPEETKPEAPRADPAQAKELTKQALSLLERGKYKDAIEKASASVDADPTDANPYLYWGTALMETGKHKDAKAIFARCAETATRGPRHECKAFR